MIQHCFCQPPHGLHLQQLLLANTSAMSFVDRLTAQTKRSWILWTSIIIQYVQVLMHNNNAVALVVHLGQRAPLTKRPQARCFSPQPCVLSLHSVFHQLPMTRDGIDYSTHTVLNVDSDENRFWHHVMATLKIFW